MHFLLQIGRFKGFVSFILIPLCTNFGMPLRRQDNNLVIDFRAKI